MVDIPGQMVLDNNNSTEAHSRGITGGMSESFDDAYRADVIARLRTCTLINLCTSRMGVRPVELVLPLEVVS